MPIAARWITSKSGYQLPFLSPIFGQTFILCSNSVFSINTVQIRFFQENAFIQEMLGEATPKITIHKDSQLSPMESMLQATIEGKIYIYTNYDPDLDRSLDRGEVKTLSYIAVKKLPYFATHDSNAIRLVEDAESLNTGLDTIQVIKMYELIYLLYIQYPSLKKSLRFLYKYQYYLTKHEKSINLEWGTFIEEMNSLYEFMPSR